MRTISLTKNLTITLVSSDCFQGVGNWGYANLPVLERRQAGGQGCGCQERGAAIDNSQTCRNCCCLKCHMNMLRIIDYCLRVSLLLLLLICYWVCLHDFRTDLELVKHGWVMCKWNCCTIVIETFLLMKLAKRLAGTLCLSLLWQWMCFIIKLPDKVSFKVYR